MQWISGYDHVEYYDLGIDASKLYKDYLNFVEQNEHVTDDASNIDFNAVVN